MNLLYALSNRNYRRQYIMDILENLFRKGLISSKQYVKLLFNIRLGYKCNLKHPETFSEKLQWLKLYDRKEIYKTFVDKLSVRAYIEKKLGKEYLVPLLGIWDRPEEIDFEMLPERFVLKCNHGSGMNQFTFKVNKDTDKEYLVNRIELALNKDYYYHAAEWPYSNMPRKILAEKMIEPSYGEEELLTYKFFCFNGEPRFLIVMKYDGEKTYHDYFNLKWERCKYIQKGFSVAYSNYKCPKNFDKMIEIAKVLSEGVPFLRVDIYNVEGEIYFGELTLYPTAGYITWGDKETDRQIGQLLILPVLN